MASRSLDDLDPRLRPLAVRFIAGCHLAGVSVFLTQTWRSDAEQDADYAQGRTRPGEIITDARGGESPHNCVLPAGRPGARAFDFAIRVPGGSLDWDASDARWRRAIQEGESLGLVSGSTFHSIKDAPHFELPDWRAVSS